MGTSDDHIKKAFAEESLDHLSGIEADLIRIEAGEDSPGQERVNQVFRAVHSIKGGAGFLGLQHITALAHAMETVLGHMRQGAIVSNAEVTHFLLQASDALENLIQYMENSDNIDISQHLEALQNLCRAADKKEEIQTPDTARTDGAEPVPATEPVCDTEETDDSRDRVPDNENMLVCALDGTRIFSIKNEVFTRLENEDKTIFFVELPLEDHENSNDHIPKTVSHQAKEYGTLLQHRVEQAYTPLAGSNFSGPFFLMLFTSVLAKEEILLVFEVPDRFVHPLGKNGSPTPAQTQTPDPEPHPDLLFQNSDTPVKEVQPVPVPDNTSPPVLRPGEKAVPSRVRVDLALLDTLMTLAGEMVLSRNQLLQAISSQDPSATQLVGQRINLITSELQETVMLTRMEPMEKIFDRFPRLVRDLGTSLGKKIRLTVKGRDVELDKSLLEAVTDPLLHLVRNSIDHGIELPDIREQADKDPVGQIILKAWQGAGKVFIEIFDDGRGLASDTLADRAVAQGLITKEQAAGMDEKEKYCLIFLPGFSTADAVSDLSGRGVGMDVVKNNIETISGKITIESLPGLGTRFLIEVPLTLAIIPSQIVLVEKERYAIAQANLEELVRIPADRIARKVEFISGAPVIRLREDLLPLVRLTDILQLQRTYVCTGTGSLKTDQRYNIADRRDVKNSRDTGASTFGPDLFHSDTPLTDSPADSTSSSQERRMRPRTDRRYRAASALNIAVVSTGAFKYGLIVDELHDAEEIVVKPLGRLLDQCRAYAGATIMGDGRVALILDISSLADMAELTPVKTPAISSKTGHTPASFQTADSFARSFLTFRGAAQERFAIPLDQVIRIEKISAGRMETMGNMTVVQTQDITLPLCALDEVADVGPVAFEDPLLVIVCDIGDHRMGLRVTGPVDALQTHETMDEKTLHQPGISGSLPIDGHTVMVVDVAQVAEKRYPQWCKNSTPRHLSKTGSPKGTILIAEDSAFFRNLIKTYIQDAGFDVIAAEDGKMALKLIKTHLPALSLVVTDMEMPHMDGFALTRAIKNDPALAHLPVIALSTLADDTDLEKGKAAGVDDYLIKLDQGNLLKSIEKHIHSKTTIHTDTADA
jgi:two-component system, chemotaxis family, sensor kinase CheA